MTQLAKIAADQDLIGACLINDDQRSSPRIRTVYRTARVKGTNDEGLARVRNISDGGLKLDTVLPVRLGDALSVQLSETTTLAGTVVWISGRECGIKFSEPVDSIELLRQLVSEIRAERTRPMRLSASLPVTVSGLDKPVSTRTVNISQSGMQVEHDARFTPGLRLKIAIGSGVEKTGVVRWVKDQFAGIMLTERFSVEELGSMSALQK